MLTIADKLRERLAAAKANAPAQPSVTSISDRAETASTGKVATSGARISNLGQRMAQQGAQVGVDQTIQQGQLAAEKLKGQEEAVSRGNQLQIEQQNVQQQMVDINQATNAALQNAARAAQEKDAMYKLSETEKRQVADVAVQYENKLNSLISEKNMSLNDIWANFGRSNKELEFRKDASELEQTAHLMRMSDTAYVDTLTRIGKMRGLEDELKFRKEIAELTLGNKKDLLMDEIKWREAYDKGTREFAEELNDMSLLQAMQIAELQAKSAQTQAIAQGVATVATTDFSKFKKENPQPQPQPTPTGGDNGK